MRLLVDTNVFLDVLLDREELAEISQYFFDKTKSTDDEIIVSVTSLKDIAYFLHRIYHDYKKTNAVLKELYNEVDKVVGVTADDTIKAVHMDGDFEDNLLIETCKTSFCDAVITNNKKDFKNKGILVMTPLDYLKQCK